MNQIITMILRMAMRTLMNKGIDAGIDRAVGPRKPKGAMTPKERAQDSASRANARRAKQGLKAVRRIGKF